LLEKGRILGAMGLAAIAAAGLAMATVFAILAVDRGGAGYFAGTVLALAVAVAFGVAVFVVAMGSKKTG